MQKIYDLDTESDLNNCGDGLAGSMLDWSMRSHLVADHSFAEYSPFLTFSKMEPEPDTAPPLFLIGKKAICRDIYGDKWADGIRQSQDIPIKDLPSATAGAYMQAMEKGFYFGRIEIREEDIRADYSRLIIPIRTTRYETPSFFATLQILHGFDRIQ